MFERFTDGAARWVGSTTSIILHTLLFIGVFGLLFIGVELDTILLVLTTVVSLEAIYLALFIQRSVNKNTETLEDVGEDIEEISEEIEDIGEEVEDIGEDLDDLEVDIDSIQEQDRQDQAEEAELEADISKLEQDIAEVKQLLAELNKSLKSKTSEK